MKDRVQRCITAGVALVGAGVMAAVPVAQQAPEVLRSANADVALAAALTGDSCGRTLRCRHSGPSPGSLA